MVQHRNDQWKVLIGANESRRGMVCRCQHTEHLVSENRWDTWGTDEEITDPAQCVSPEPWFSGQDSYVVDCHVVNNARLNWVEREHDGLVLRRSQEGIPAHFMLIGIKPIVMLGSSHFGMRNDENLMHRLRVLFNGDVHPAFFLHKLVD